MKKALFAGSFDPFTLGHFDIVQQGLNVFDHITILIAVSPEKKNVFSSDERKKMLNGLFPADKITVEAYSGVVVDYGKNQGIHYLIRGIRNSVDLRFEQQLLEMNKILAPDLHTVWFSCRQDYQHISSSYVREFLKYRKSIKDLVPESVCTFIEQKDKNGN